jgi:ABC-type multidrug transport system fused ATPase/permease subunit
VNNKTTYNLLSKLWCHISSRRKKHFILLLILATITSIAEVISLGSVMPFIGVITNPDQIFKYKAIHKILLYFGYTNSHDLVIPICFGFLFAIVIAGILRLVLLWSSTLLTNGCGSDLSVEVYKRTLYQSYEVHIERSSSEIISGITQKVGAATSVLMSITTAITSSFLFVSIIFTLIIIDPMVSIVAALTFSFSYLLIAKISKKHLLNNSNCIALEQTNVIKSLQEGLGAIRDVLLDGTQKIFINVYKNSVTRLQNAIGQNTFINQAPRFAMESIGMCLIVIFVIILKDRDGGINAALPILAMLALGAQRLLPLMQMIFGNWSTVVGNKESLLDVVLLLDQRMPNVEDKENAESIKFENNICLEDVWFKYSNKGPWILSGVNLEIQKGERIGLIGSTGSGKSTVLDLTMGLLMPTKGNIKIDGVKINSQQIGLWQKRVAHVPQNIFLADATIAENIAFGVPAEKIDINKVQSAAQKAQIADFIEKGNLGYNLIVGERGVKLSGGQRQRIGIARALYKEANFLIFDEATSALDSETESEVMNAIDSLSNELTIMIVAHRISTLKKCDKIIKLDLGKVVSISKYDEIIRDK